MPGRGQGGRMLARREGHTNRREERTVVLVIGQLWKITFFIYRQGLPLLLNNIYAGDSAFGRGRGEAGGGNDFRLRADATQSTAAGNKRVDYRTGRGIDDEVFKFPK